MKRTLLSVTCLFALSSMMPIAWATDYYVSPSGNDSNNGSSGAPWQTIARVNKTKYVAGDRILFQGSATFPGRIYFGPGSGGNATTPVTVTSYGTGTAVIDAGTGPGAFYAWDTAGIDLNNLIFKGSSYGANVSNAAGILFYNDLGGNSQLPRVHINNVEVYGFGAVNTGGVDGAGYPLRAGGAGISIGGWNGGSGFTDIQITSSNIHDNEGTGITFWGPGTVTNRNILISRTQSHQNSGYSRSPAQATGGGLLLFDVSSALVDSSKFWDNGMTGSGSSGVVVMQSDHVTVQHCASWSNHSAANSDGNAFDFDGGTTDSILQYNYSWGNDGAGYLLAEPPGFAGQTRNVIRYNISEEDGGKFKYGGIHLWNGGSGIDNIEIYNNTVYANPAWATSNLLFIFQNPMSNIHVRNNIFMAASSAVAISVWASLPGAVFQDNDYWIANGSLTIYWPGGAYNSVASWSAATGLESGGPQSVDPVFVAPDGGYTGYHLQSWSPLIDRGTTVTLPGGFAYGAPAQDYYGATVPQGAAYDIGASETR